MQYISRALLSEQALGVLRRAIVTGELAPGAPVKDVELAARMGLSRTPVREALAKLAEEGLIETKPHSYTRVTPLDPSVVRDALQVVQTMHALATRVARLTPEHLTEMRAVNLAFAAAIDSGAVDEAMAYDDAFHDIPVRATGNGAIAATIRRYTPVLHRAERLYFDSPLGRDSAPMHDRIIAACEAGDVDRAAALAEENWANLARMVEDL